jgi:2-pyrone-4,6-dicarboxylate lactonase
MDTTIDRDALCPRPDPAPHAPTRFTVPPGAVDTHAHLVGEELVADRSYTPPPATEAEYLHMLDAVGMTYGVLVQVSVHGTDNSLMLATLRAHRERLRGVAVVPPDVDDRSLGELADAGVVGLRLNTVSGGGISLDQLDRYEPICREMGWHLQFLTGPAHLREIAPRLGRLDVPYVIDHMGDPDVAAGTATADWNLVEGLVSDGAWTKISGAFRMDTPPYDRTVAFARSLIAAAPDRCVWGSDWPHVGFFGPMPGVGDLLDLLADWAPDTAELDAVLTTNAHRLYGFGEAS